MTMIPPEVAPDAEPIVCVQLNRVWMGYILGAVEKLAFPGWWDEQGIDAQDKVEAILGLLSLGNCEPPEEYMYPENVFVPGIAGEVASGGVLTRQHDAASDLACYAFQSSAGDGNETWFRFFCAAGDYDLVLCYVKDNNRGKVELRIDDGDLIATDDLYASSLLYNQYTSHEVSVLADGVHFLKLKVNGKNASSSAYYWVMSHFMLIAQFI